ncbi:hypothetical protein DL768_009509 [Monosporascus sp. mg162]|nr:hypothetical protein DL768_009509 [Monosporascus sp. mg162]
MVSGIFLPKVFGTFCNPAVPFTRNTIATVCLDNQIFYAPPVAAGLKLTSRNKDVNAAPGASGDSDAKEPPVTSGADPGDESVSTQQQAKADNPLCHPQTPPDGSSDAGEAEQLLNGRSLPREDECPAETGDDNDCPPSTRSGSREGTLFSDKGVEGDESGLASAELPLQPPDGQDQVDFRRDIGRHCNANFEEHYHPVEDSVTEHSRDDDVVQRPRKRRRISTSTPTICGTAPERQTRLHCTSSRSRQAQRPTQCPQRRRSQRSIPNPPSSRGPALEEETVTAPVAKFEEWPLTAVLKRVIVDGVATF